MSKKLLVLVSGLTIIAAACNQTTPSMTINGHKLNIEIANTDEKRAQGLSNRTSLDSHSGMLFIMPTAAKHNFWMKDMKFALDLIWIRNDQIVEITPNVGFTDQTKLYSSSVDADQILEVNAGWAAQNGIKVGDTVELTQ